MAKRGVTYKTLEAAIGPTFRAGGVEMTQAERRALPFRKRKKFLERLEKTRGEKWRGRIGPKEIKRILRGQPEFRAGSVARRVIEGVFSRAYEGGTKKEIRRKIEEVRPQIKKTIETVPKEEVRARPEIKPLAVGEEKHKEVGHQDMEQVLKRLKSQYQR